MKSEEQLGYKKTIFSIPLLLVFTIWFVYWVEIKFGFNFNKFGVFPRTLNGLKGAFLMHFIHSNTNHLFNNSIPLFVLSTSLFYFYRKVAFRIILIGSLITGVITWVIARESFHIGASGTVYLLFSFIFFSGIIRQHYRLVAMSLIIIFFYGSMIWYVIPIKEGISWEGHLAGFLTGITFAFLYRKQGIVKEKFEFTKTDFDNQFDKEGNYIQPLVEEDNIVDLEINPTKPNKPIAEINYKYFYKEDE